ncbi:LacI family DNA-binding transcriptional regulator [Streptomyces sp. M19]
MREESARRAPEDRGLPESRARGAGGGGPEAGDGESGAGARRPGRGTGRGTSRARLAIPAEVRLAARAARRSGCGRPRRRQPHDRVQGRQRPPRVRSDLRERVLAAVAELGYARNAVATSLRRPDLSPWTVGLILHDVGNPFSAAMHRAVEDVVRSVGSFVLTASTDEDHERMGLLLDEFRDRNVDGILLAPPPGDQSYLSAHLRRGTALVLVDRPPRGWTRPRSSATTRAACGRRSATCFTTAIAVSPTSATCGRHRCACASPGTGRRSPRPGSPRPRCSTTAPRAPRRRGAPPSASRRARAARRRSSPPATPCPSARCGPAPRRCPAPRRAAGLRRRRVGRELEPGLTVVAQDPAAIGRAAATALIERLSDPPARSPDNCSRRG